MKIINVIGGLGNQMFQYAFALSLKQKRPNEDVYIDTHHFKGYPLFNGYEIGSVFENTTLPIAKRKQIKKVSRYIPHFKLSRFVRRYLPKRETEYIAPYTYKYLPSVYDIEGDCYFEGYWQSYKYFDSFKDVVIREFEFPQPNDYNKDISYSMSSCNSVGIHVRRGDYVNNNSFGGICNEAYYKKSIELIIQRIKAPVFYLFSNDFEWCKDNIVPLLNERPYFVIDKNIKENSFYDMYLMTKCKNLIIANSSFSWWGAYLNINEGLIVAPHQWNKIAKEENMELLLPSWELI